MVKRGVKLLDWLEYGECVVKRGVKLLEPVQYAAAAAAAVRIFIHSLKLFDCGLLF